MSEPKWTKGPWKWRDDRVPDSIEGEFRGLDGPNGEDVIRLEDVYPGYAECGEDLRACVERPNQFLIVAAPELYDALEEIQFKGHNQVCPICKGSKNTGHGAMCDVGRALAKARGKS